MFQFNMTFIEKCAEDPGLHYPWLLAGLNDWTTMRNQIVYLNSAFRLLQFYVKFVLQMDEFLFKTKEILQQFSIAWDQVVVEKDPHFYIQFQEVQNSNRLVIRNKLRLK